MIPCFNHISPKAEKQCRFRCDMFLGFILPNGKVPSFKKCLTASAYGYQIVVHPFRDSARSVRCELLGACAKQILCFGGSPSYEIHLIPNPVD